MKELVIAEKPSAARKIAAALKTVHPSASLKTVRYGKVSYHEISLPNKTVYVVAAVGHVFGLKQKSRGFTYPIFDVDFAFLVL